ncbi:MAG: 3-oxoacyl-ACP synthase [Spirochaetes bacterium]|nr:3-oxoacyl-ACP synthase [Spirochaetota bacterium]
MYKSRFESMGVYLPEKIVTTRELIDRMEAKPHFDLETLTGISARRWRSDEEDSYTLASEAVLRALEKSSYVAQDIDVIISCSITRFKGGLSYYMEPALSKYIKDNLGFRESAMNFDMTNACAGMLTGVYILNNMIKSGLVKNGLVVSGECITPISETALKEIREPVDAQFASLTVGDSGSALIMDRALEANDGIDFIEFMTLAEFAELCFGMPSTEHSGVAMYTDAIAIHREVIKRLPKLFEYLIKKYNVNATDYDYIIPHQTSARAISTAFNMCSPHFDGIPEILMSLDKYGNTSSTSHFVVLEDHLSGKKMKEHARVLFVSLASGIAIGFISAKLGKLEVNYGYYN